MSDEYDDVRKFQLKFSMLVHQRPTHLTERKLKERYDFMWEELREFRDAVMADDLAGQADALVDLVYVALGTAVSMGLPWRALWDDVQRANMAKVRGVGSRGHLVDCVKPPGWVPPATLSVLEAHGYDPKAPRRHRDDPEHEGSPPLSKRLVNCEACERPWSDHQQGEVDVCLHAIRRAVTPKPSAPELGGES